MRALTLLCLFALTLSASRGRDGAMTVKLTVKLNGKRLPAPRAVTLSFKGRSRTVPVHNGEFGVPALALTAKTVTVSFDASGERIQIPSIREQKLEEESWTILLADTGYGEEYDWLIPKGADIRSSCILEFSSIDSDPGTGVFVRGCRQKLPQHR